MIPFVLPFLFRWGKVIAVAAIVAAVALYVGNAERNRGLVKLLEAETATHIQTIAHQDEQLLALNQRIEANNARWLEMVAQERKRVILARVEAERIKAQRDTVTAELAASRRDWQEAVAHDPNLAEFIAHPVPAAVWGRLRRATGG